MNKSEILIDLVTSVSEGKKNEALTLKKNGYVSLVTSIESDDGNEIPEDTVVKIISIDKEQIVLKSPDDETITLPIKDFPHKIVK